MSEQHDFRPRPATSTDLDTEARMERINHLASARAELERRREEQDRLRRSLAQVHGDLMAAAQHDALAAGLTPTLAWVVALTVGAGVVAVLLMHESPVGAGLAGCLSLLGGLVLLREAFGKARVRTAQARLGGEQVRLTDEVAWAEACLVRIEAEAGGGRAYITEQLARLIEEAPLVLDPCHARPPSHESPAPEFASVTPAARLSASA